MRRRQRKLPNPCGVHDDRYQRRWEYVRLVHPLHNRATSSDRLLRVVLWQLIEQDHIGQGLVHPDPAVGIDKAELAKATFASLPVHFLADADVITPLLPRVPAIYAERSVDAIAVLGRLKAGMPLEQAGA